MADISKCTAVIDKDKDEICPLKDTCYRYTAVGNKFRQTYMKTPYDNDLKKCDYYWKDIRKKQN